MPATRATVKKPTKAPRPSDARRSRLGDLTRPIAIDRRLSKDRRSAFLLGIVAVAIAGTLAAALFVIPVRTYLNQDDMLAERQDQVDQLEAVNNDLRAEVERLRSDDGAAEAARQELGYIEGEERRETVLDYPALPTELPAGWPYSLVNSIVALRAAP